MLSFRRFILPYISVIQNRRYFPLWLGQLVSSLGDTLNYIALVVYVYQLTGSGFDLSKLSIFQITPILLISPLAGVVIDRFRRKNVLIAADVVRALLILGLAIAPNLTAIYAIAVLVATATTFFRPTVQAVIPAVVSEEELLAANSVAWSTEQLVQIVGSAVAGGLILWIGPKAAFVFNAGTFLFSAAMIATMLEYHGDRLNWHCRLGGGRVGHPSSLSCGRRTVDRGRAIWAGPTGAIPHRTRPRLSSLK
jgi:MFS family permease